MSLGARVKQFRLDKGLTQQQLAEHLKMGRSNIGHIENDRVAPTSTALKLMAKLFNTTSDFLLYGEDKTTNTNLENSNQENEVYDQQLKDFKLNKAYKQTKIVYNWFLNNQMEVPEILTKQLKALETEKQQHQEYLNNLVKQFQPCC